LRGLFALVSFLLPHASTYTARIFFRHTRHVSPPLQRGPNGTPYTELDVAVAIRKMVPCIEVVGTRFSPAASAALPPIALLSDFGGAHAVIKGNRHFKNWADVALDQTAVTMRVNGEVRASGRGADVLGHPVRALTWLVNYLSARNIALHKDAFVITGTCTGLTPVKAGDKVTAEFDGMGEVEVQLA
jgi:2-keto-4-pentenoate hydratase